MSLLIDDLGISTEGAGHEHVSWTDVTAAHFGQPGELPDGSAALVLSAMVHGQVWRWIVPSWQVPGDAVSVNDRLSDWHERAVGQQAPHAPLAMPPKPANLILPPPPPATAPRAPEWEANEGHNGANGAMVAAPVDGDPWSLTIDAPAIERDAAGSVAEGQSTGTAPLGQGSAQGDSAQDGFFSDGAGAGAAVDVGGEASAPSAPGAGIPTAAGEAAWPDAAWPEAGPEAVGSDAAWPDPSLPAHDPVRYQPYEPPSPDAPPPPLQRYVPFQPPEVEDVEQLPRALGPGAQDVPSTHGVPGAGVRADDPVWSGTAPALSPAVDPVFAGGGAPPGVSSAGAGVPARAAPNGRRWAALAVAAVAAVVVVGGVVAALALSSGTSNSPGSAAGSSTSPVTTPTTSGAPNPADQLLAQSINITQQDVPSGWTIDTSSNGPLSGFTSSASSGTTAQDRQANAVFISCLGVPASEGQIFGNSGPKAAAQASSPAFSAGLSPPDVAEIGSQTQIFTSATKVSVDTAEIRRPNFTNCIGKAVALFFTPASLNLPAGSHIGPLTVSPITLEQVAPAAAVGAALTVPVQANGTAQSINFNLVFVGGGHAETTIYSVAVGQPFPALVTAETAYQVEKRIVAAGPNAGA